MARELEIHQQLRAADAAFYADVKDAEKRRDRAYARLQAFGAVRAFWAQVTANIDEAARREIEHDRGM